VQWFGIAGHRVLDPSARAFVASASSALIADGRRTGEVTAVSALAVGADTVFAEAAEQALRAGDDDPAAQLAEGTDPPIDTGATAEFRAHLARVIGRRAIEEAMLKQRRARGR
jgi:CO/xanthine dehydrogenase FAD-binding subunit